MQEIERIELRQYIKNGFIRSGLSYFGYGIFLSLITALLGYGAYLIHQKNSMFHLINYDRIEEYLLIFGVSILTMIIVSIFISGIKSFRRLDQFMLTKDVKLVTAHQTETSLSIGLALHYLNDEELIYENRHLIMTSQHVIILEGEACIQPRHLLKAAYINFHDLEQNQSMHLKHLKTLTLVFEDHEIKKVKCHYIEEAKDLLNALKEQGIKVYHGIDSYERGNQ